jgi:hypothetical protein
MENNCKLIGDNKWDTPKTREDIAELLNKKQKTIEELREENKFLKWYCEELEVHVPSDKVEQIKALYKSIVKQSLI